jgi:hypothetical protein
MGKERVKGNLKPASSSKAAAFGDLSFGFGSVVGEELPHDFKIIVKKLLKKDSTTKTRFLLLTKGSRRVEGNFVSEFCTGIRSRLARAL